MSHRVLAVLLLFFLATVHLPAAEPNRGDRMLDAYFRGQVQAIADASLADVKTRADWEKKRPELHRQFLDMLGLWPLPPRTDLKPTLTGRLETEHFTVEKLHFQSLPGLYVTANLYLPKKVTKPAPAVLYVCGHGNTVIDKVSYGSKVNYQHHPAWFAEHGYVCLILDTLQLAEIEGIHHGTHPSKKLNWWWWHTVGYTPAGVECWNAMRAIDYLQSRPEVDPKKIGVTGRSGGGATSWWVAAADERVQCAVPVAGIADLWAHVVEGEAASLKKGVVAGHCDCMYFVNTYRWDFPTMVALIAPRPVLLGNSDVDSIFPVPGYRRIADKVRPIYSLYGAAEKFDLLETKGPHKDTPELRLGAFRWMNRWLKDDNSEVTEEERPRLTAQQLRVFERLPADEINTTVHEVLRKPATVELPTVPEVAKEWWKGQREQWLTELQRLTFAGWPRNPPALATQRAADVEHEGVRLRAWDFLSEENIPLRVWLLTSRGVEKPTRLEINVCDEKEWDDWAKWADSKFKDALQLEKEPTGDPTRFATLRKALESESKAVALVAPRGIGPTRWSAARGSAEDSHIRRRFPLIGQTLDGQRVWDVRRSVAVLRELPDLKDVRIELHGRNEAAGIALYAAIFEPTIASVELWNLPPSHREGPTLLNVRRVLDVPQAVTLVLPRPVNLHITERKQKDAWKWALNLQGLLGQEAIKIHETDD